MRAFAIVFGAFVLILTATEVSAAILPMSVESGAGISAAAKRAPAQAEDRAPARTYTCKIVTGYGTAIGRGSSQLAAKEAARELCGSKLIDQYFAQRGKISEDAAADLIEACVNLDCQ